MPTDARFDKQGLELALIAVLIVVFVAVAAHRIWLLRIAAEQTAVVTMLGSIRSAIGIQTMQRVLHGGIETLVEMDRANPVDYLEPVPANYELLAEPLAAEQMFPYRWYFDTTRHQLIYRVANGEYLETNLPGPARIRFQLQLRYLDTNQNGSYEAGTDTIQGIELVELDRYRWLQPG